MLLILPALFSVPLQLFTNKSVSINFPSHDVYWVQVTLYFFVDKPILRGTWCISTSFHAAMAELNADFVWTVIC